MAHTYVNNEEEEKTQMHVPESHVMLWWILHCDIFTAVPQSTLLWHSSCSCTEVPNDVMFLNKCLCYSLYRTEGNSPTAEGDSDPV